MNTRSLLTLFLLLLPVHAKSNDIAMAQRSDLIGIWASIEINNQFQPKLLPTSPWPLKCQWFAFFEDGRYATFMKTEGSSGSCDGDPKVLAEYFEKAPATMSFKWIAGKEQDKGLVFVGSTEQKNYVEIWSPHLFKVDADVRGEKYQKGDLFLRLLSPKNFTDTLWLRHLRRVDAQPAAPGDALPAMPAGSFRPSASGRP